MIDDPHRSTIGDLMRSVLTDLRKGVTPTQARIGNALAQFYLIGPVNTGSFLAYLFDTEASFSGNPGTNGLGILYLSFDFEIVAIRLLEDASLGDGDVTQLQVFGTSVMMTSASIPDASGFTALFPLSGNATLFNAAPSGTELPTAIYPHGGGYSVAYFDVDAGAPPGVGRFTSSGAYEDVQKYYNVTSGDISADQVPFYDGSSIFMGFSKSATRGVLKASASDPSTVSAVTFSAPGTLGATPLLLGGNSSVVCGRVGRGTDSEVFFGLNPSTLAVLWAKSTKKQESTATIGVNDTATTYRITIGAQFEEVTGQAGGAAATATALKNQCAASAQTQFTQRTFTASGDTVTVRANDAGILYTFSASVTGGTGTISTSTNQFLLPLSLVNAAAVAADTDGSVAIATNTYGVLTIDADNGNILAAAKANTSNGGTNMATVLGGVTYITGGSEYPAAFGPLGDSDGQVFRFASPPNNLTLLTDDVSLMATALAITAEEVGWAPDDMTLTSTPLSAPLDTFEILETEYTY